MQACSYCYPKPKHLVICVIVGYSVTVLIPVLVKLTTPSLFQSFGVDSGEGRLAPSIFGIVIRVLLSQHEQMFSRCYGTALSAKGAPLAEVGKGFRVLGFMSPDPTKQNPQQQQKQQTHATP